MHGRLKGKKIRSRESLKGWAITLLAAVVTYVLLVVAHRKGIPRRWVTAIMGTLAPFSLVIYAFRQWLFRWTFWVSLAVCLIVHIAAVWILFRYALIGIESLSIWLWLPVMLIEAFVLLVVVKRIEERLTGKHETIKFSL